MIDLNGWKYVGRKISDEFHSAVLTIAEYIEDPLKVAEKTWPAIQKDLAMILNVKTGQVRTLKSCMEEVGILKIGSLNQWDIPSPDEIYTKDGIDIINTLKAEKILKMNPTTQNMNDIHEMDKARRLLYLKALAKSTLRDDNNVLHPLRALLKSLKKYEVLDFWEWYMINSIIRNDNNLNEEERLDKMIFAYRNGKIPFEDLNIKSQKLSHSYILGNYEYTGIVIRKTVKDNGGRPFKFEVSMNPDMMSIINEIMK